VDVVERMQKVVSSMANEEEDAVLAGIARIKELEAALRHCFSVDVGGHSCSTCGLSPDDTVHHLPKSTQE
jgi:uncharacterized protein (UPF0212 family)